MNLPPGSSERAAHGPATVRVRCAQPGDASTLARFNLRMAAETEALALSPDVVLEGVRAVLSDPMHGFYAVAEDDGTIVGGLLVTYEWSDWRNGRFWWIQSVYVLPSHRRRGVYRALHAFTADRARAVHGVKGLRLYVERDNHLAQGVYRSVGMRESGYRLFEQELPAP